jgi:hypothetical protein
MQFQKSGYITKEDLFFNKGTLVCIQGYSFGYRSRRGGQQLVGPNPGLLVSIHTLQLLLTLGGRGIRRAQ